MLIKVLQFFLLFKEVISWISKQSVWTDTNGIHCVGNLRFQCYEKDNVKDKKNITTQEMQFIEILYTVPEWLLDYAV